MSKAVRELEPLSVWNFFEDLNAVPRPSKKEDQVRKFMVEFGQSRGLPTRVDDIGNVIITKPASSGMESRHTVVLQGHLDMVHQKNEGTDFNFNTQGIKSYIDGEWVRADGTTLGADNGMGVAAIMAVLDADDIAHPPIEALFTIDEETGMTGAQNLKAGELTGKYLLNLDTEDDRELTIGCAGGIDTTAEMSYIQKESSEGSVGVKLTVSGLVGGHSGMDIHLGRGNANKIMNVLVRDVRLHYGAAIHSIRGGSLRNAIPRESTAILAVRDFNGFSEHIRELAMHLKEIYRKTDPNLTIDLSEVEVPKNVMNKTSQRDLIAAISAAPNGVFRMSAEIEGLTETSSNLAKVNVANGKLTVKSLQRSALEFGKMEVAHAVGDAFALMGAHVTHSGSYPGWAPKPDSSIVKLMDDLYTNMYGEQADVNACHAGLECGILGANYPEMEMISFGPTITGAHSPDESVKIASVQKFWKFFLATLEQIPEKK
ncbi:MAG TPA: cytosol nonspecific dipeptidase [Flavobacteriales bacterium]|jgi:dipeptidase D|nr:cytosol nonspecific dipeptidase [Flavobacteriales bacterium]